ncbi:NUDIX hydrolase [Pluralibacter gergoviae]|uniref:NUDIX hydrolase n=1 Tax=Pluralibacter gergoviae TaxID=61647 RepID=UPI0008DC239C|nr:NUDIX domain-containing protein [Pluralibacter gergoviae]EKW6619925.1 NUDIX domain-containing protein [Pluralibacter gergoviae]OHY66617.1 NUDIX hydrolase [Pluralibacter gergoviae]
MSTDNVIRIAAAIIEDSEGRVLLVRKKNTAYFMQPGGKPEPGESATSALIRELNEELQISVTAESLAFVGQFTDVAANEANHRLVADIYRITASVGDIFPAAEIEEIIWLSPDAGDERLLAPLTKNQILPLVKHG